MARGYEQVYRWMRNRAPVIHHTFATGRPGLAVAGRGSQRLTGPGWPLP
jgi:hypothetical protein